MEKKGFVVFFLMNKKSSLSISFKNQYNTSYRDGGLFLLARHPWNFKGRTFNRITSKEIVVGVGDPRGD